MWERVGVEEVSTEASPLLRLMRNCAVRRPSPHPEQSEGSFGGGGYWWRLSGAARHRIQNFPRYPQPLRIRKMRLIIRLCVEPVAAVAEAAGAVGMGALGAGVFEAVK